MMVSFESNKALPAITKVEDIIANGAYEASMHFLIPNTRSIYGTYKRWPIPIDEPTAEYAEKAIDRTQFDGFLMWVEFYEYQALDDSCRLSVRKRQIGDVALSDSPDSLVPLQSMVENGEFPAFTRLWLSHYTSDTTKDFFGELNHPHIKQPEPSNLLAKVDHQPTNGLSVERTVQLAHAALQEDVSLHAWLEAMRIPYQLPEREQLYSQKIPEWLLSN